MILYVHKIIHSWLDVVFKLSIMNPAKTKMVKNPSQTKGGGSNASDTASKVSDISEILFIRKNRSHWVLGVQTRLHIVYVDIVPINKSVIRGWHSNLSFQVLGFPSSKNGLEAQKQAQAWSQGPRRIIGKRCVRFLGSRTILELWRFRQCYCQTGKGGKPDVEVLSSRQPSEGVEIIFRKSKFERGWRGPGPTPGSSWHYQWVSWRRAVG